MTPAAALHHQTTNPDTPKSYEIRLKGHLDARWLEHWGEHFNVHQNDNTTTLTGTVDDQAALHGLLRHIRDLGLPLLSVRRQDNSTNSRWGGIAALVEASTYLIGIVMLFTMLSPTLTLEPPEYVAFIRDNHLVMHLWIWLIYLVNGSFLVVLVHTLSQRLRGMMASVTAAFGFIWAGLVLASGMLTLVSYNTVVDMYAVNPEQASSTWQTLLAVQNGLGGSIELPGGVWMLLVSLGGWRTLPAILPRWVNVMGAVAGLAGVLTSLPGLSELTAVFGLTAIVWFIAVGVVLLRKPQAN
jgi:hypothetical protein